MSALRGLAKFERFRFFNSLKNPPKIKGDVKLLDGAGNHLASIALEADANTSEQQPLTNGPANAVAADVAVHNPHGGAATHTFQVRPGTWTNKDLKRILEVELNVGPWGTAGAPQAFVAVLYATTANPETMSQWVSDTHNV